MNKLSACTGIFTALALGAGISLSAAAAPVNTAAPTIDLAAAQKARTSVQAQVSRAKILAKKLGAISAIPTGSKPAEVYANVDRAYPPSCLNSPMALGLWQNDPNVSTANILLPGDPLSGNGDEANYTETDTVTLFRVVCSGGQSATLLEIDRPSAHEGDSSHYPTFPSVSANGFSASPYFMRLADDPNTFYTTTYGLTPLINSNVFVLENFYGGSIRADYNQAFTLVVDNLLLGGYHQSVSFPLPAYNPADYAEASQPLPISGYMSTAWYDPAHSGEGMFIQVYDNGDGATRTLTATWYTYDNLGIPFWLYAQGTLNIGDRQLDNVGVDFLSGGGFAGSANATPQPWGTMSFSFPDCADLTFSYHSTTTALPNGPTGSGERFWQRVADVNGLVCQ